MTASHPSLLRLQAITTTDSEPPLKRVKLDENLNEHKMAIESAKSESVLQLDVVSTTYSLGDTASQTVKIGGGNNSQLNCSKYSNAESSSEHLKVVPQSNDTNINLQTAVIGTISSSNSSHSSLGATPVANTEPENPSVSTSLTLQSEVVTSSSIENVSPSIGTVPDTNLEPTVIVVKKETQQDSISHNSHEYGPQTSIQQTSDTANLSVQRIEIEAQDGKCATLSEENIPLKSTAFHHLRHKYLGELEYMLREFQKLERQLLGAKTQNTVETDGSRERREKLHSFILHLEETIQQIITGCQLETEGKTTISVTLYTGSSLSDDVTREKAEEENVQKLEEHILANLLPVKVRLKRQLAAQQGAKHNPAGMPTVRGGMQPLASGTQHTKATFLRSNPPAQKHTSQFGKPLEGAGSSLTQKLHGQTLGSSARIHGHGVGQPSTTEKQLSLETNTGNTDVDQQHIESTKEYPKILYAGMALGSNQVQSSVCAASSVHNLVIRNPVLLERATLPVKQSKEEIPIPADNLSSTWSNPPSTAKSNIPTRQGQVHVNQATHQTTVLSDPITDVTKIERKEPFVAVSHTQMQKSQQQCHQIQNTVPQTLLHIEDHSKNVTNENCALTPAARNAIICYEERRRRLKKRQKKKKKQGEQQKIMGAQGVGLQVDMLASKRNKKTQSQRGPRNVEYMCALCNEIYNSTCDYNPWWALTQHECPKCQKVQIPRVDISAPANAIEYHPALLAHADENGGGGTPSAVMFIPPKATLSTSSSDSESDLSDDDGLLSDGDDSLDFSDSETEDIASMSIVDQAENEKFGSEYDGPKLSENHASRLLILMLHSSTCPGQHRSENHNDVCRSTKWMMLHARDCPGTTVTSDICPFPWCRKVKHFLYHLVSCETPSECPICSPVSSNANMRRLSALNAFRIEKRRSFFCQRVATLREAQNLSTDTPEDRFSPLKHCEPCKTSSSRGTDNLTVHPSLVTASSTEPSIPSLNAINTIDAVTSEKCQIIDKYVDSVAAAQRQTLPLEVALSVVNDKSQFAMVATLDKPHEGIILTSTPHTLVSNTVSNSVCKQESLQGSVCTRMLLDTEAAIAQVPTSHSVKKDTDLLPEVAGTFPSAHLTLPSTTDQPATQNDSSTLSAFSEGDHARLTVLSTSDQPSTQNVSSTMSVFSKGDHSGTITNSLPSSSSTKASVVRCLDAVDIMVPESAPAAITYIKLESVTSDSINIVEKVQGALIINSEVAEVSSIHSILLSTTEIEENKLQSQCSELGNSSTQVSEKIVVDTMVPLQDLNLTVLVDNTEVILHAGIVKLENENETEAIPEKNSVSILSQISVQDDANIKSDTLFVPIEDPLSSIVKEEQTLSKVDATLDEVPDEQRTLHCLSSPGKDNVDIGAITNTIEKPNVSEFKTEQSTIRNDRVSNENLILRVQ